MKKYFKNLFWWLIFIFQCSFFIWQIYSVLESSEPINSKYLLIFFWGYFLLITISLQFFRRTKIGLIISFPVDIMPYFILFSMALGIIYLISNISVSIVIKFFDFNISDNSQFYLKISMSTILVTEIGQNIMSFLFSDKMNEDKTYKYWETTKQKTIKASEKQQIRYYVFILYFIAIVFFTTLKIDKRMTDFNEIILQSFATYVAYDRVMSTRKNLKKEESKK